jgi:hypothetical protein
LVLVIAVLLSQAIDGRAILLLALVVNWVVRLGITPSHMMTGAHWGAVGAASAPRG